MKNLIIILCASLIFLTCNLQSQTWFGPQNVISTNAAHARSVYAADLDGDGDMDVLSASEMDNKIAWYENTDGNGTFGPQQIITTNAIYAQAVYTADIDNDGDMDVLSASGIDGKIAWYKNTDGNGTFGPQQIITTDAINARSVYTADIDGDDDMDVLSASVIPNKIAWYRNIDGNGTFGNQQIISTEPNNPYSVFATDIDSDGDIDVLSSSKFDNKVAWYENTDPGGTFGPLQIISTNAYGAYSVFASDIDGDGDMDVLSASIHDDKVAWYENTNGNGAFGIQQIITTNASVATSVYASDIDGDGDIDVLSASFGIDNSKDSKIAWYENTDGNGSFGPQQVITTIAKNAYAVFAIDIDGDGDIDVLSASYGDNKIAWYENMTIVGIETTPQNKISIYPNPTSEKITLDFAENEIQQLKIIDLSGKILFEKTEVQPNESIDLSALPCGIYILSIQTEKEILTRKIVKE